MLVKGSKIRLKQAIPNAPFSVGTIMEIDDIGKNTISCSFPGGGGIMSLAELETYFEEVPPKVKRVWGEWTCEGYFSNAVLTDNEGYVWKRNNGKITQVKITDTEDKIFVTSRASCHPSDCFDPDKGFFIAFGRALIKLGMK